MSFSVKKLTQVGKWDMNTERFVARDSKSALEKVKLKLGADALILSTKRSDAGVEIQQLMEIRFSQTLQKVSGLVQMNRSMILR